MRYADRASLMTGPVFTGGRGGDINCSAFTFAGQARQMSHFLAIQASCTASSGLPVRRRAKSSISRRMRRLQAARSLSPGYAIANPQGVLLAPQGNSRGAKTDASIAPRRPQGGARPFRRHRPQIWQCSRRIASAGSLSAETCSGVKVMSVRATGTAGAWTNQSLARSICDLQASVASKVSALVSLRACPNTADAANPLSESYSNIARMEQGRSDGPTNAQCYREKKHAERVRQGLS